MIGNLTYENVVESVWRYYEAVPHLNLNRKDYTLQIILGLQGPTARDTKHLRHKTDLYVEFLRKEVCNISITLILH